jgi:putative acetyltransferase
MSYPDVFEPAKAGSYPAVVCSGGGYVWDEVLEYRVWCSPARGADDLADGNDYYYAFVTFDEAQAAAHRYPGAAEPLALVLQREYIDQTGPGEYRHVRQQRVTEWPVEFLGRPRRDSRTIPDFLAPDAPSNRLEILRGQAPRST